MSELVNGAISGSICGVGVCAVWYAIDHTSEMFPMAMAIVGMSIIAIGALVFTVHLVRR